MEANWPILKEERIESTVGIATAGNPVVRLVEVRKHYEGDRRQGEILKGVSLVVPSGQALVIRGVSGSGKSTLLNLIGGLDSASSGRVIVGGRDLGVLSRGELTDFRRTRIGFVFQFFNLLPTLTALENVQLGLEAGGLAPGPIDERSRRALEEVGLAHCAGRFPEEMSGGEQQRLAIARATAREPFLLLADEPTGNLDEEASRTVLSLLQALRERSGTTLIVATHDPAMIALGDLTLSLRGGLLTGDGALP